MTLTKLHIYIYNVYIGPIPPVLSIVIVNQCYFINQTPHLYIHVYIGPIPPFLSIVIVYIESMLFH